MIDAVHHLKKVKGYLRLRVDATLHQKKVKQLREEVSVFEAIQFVVEVVSDE